MFKEEMEIQKKSNGKTQRCSRRLRRAGTKPEVLLVCQIPASVLPDRRVGAKEGGFSGFMALAHKTRGTFTSLRLKYQQSIKEATGIFGNL